MALAFEKKTKSRILIATGIFPPDIGGPATMLEALSGALDKNGFEVGIISYSDRGGREKLEGGIEVLRVKRGRIFSRLIYFLKLGTASRNTSLIYAMDTYSVGYFCYLLKRFFGKKYILRFAGDAAWETAVAKGWTNDYIAEFQTKKYDERIERMKKRRNKVFQGADKIIAVSGFLAGLLKKNGIEADKIEVVYNSIGYLKEDHDPALIRKIRDEYNGSSKIIMTACRLTPWKGVEAMIRIMPRLISQIGKINFLVLGDGSELPGLKETAKNLGLENKIFFLGKIDRKIIGNYYRAADVFVYNTNYEGLSHTLLEVMRAGTPIVTTRAGGNPETVEDGKTGFLADYNDEDGFTKAIIRLLGDENLAKEVTANASFKLKEFDWDKTVQNTVLVILDILKK